MHTHTRDCPEGKLQCVFRMQSSSEASSGGFDKHSSTNYAALFDSLMYLLLFFSLCVSLLSCTEALKVNVVTRESRRAEMKSPQKELSGIKSEGLAPIFLPKAHLGHIDLFTGSLK